MFVFSMTKKKVLSSFATQKPPPAVSEFKNAVTNLNNNVAVTAGYL